MDVSEKVQMILFSDNKYAQITLKIYWRLRTLLKEKFLPPQRRVVFLHIPKTAGTSVNLYLKTLFGSGGSKRVCHLNDSAVEHVAPNKKTRCILGHLVGIHTCHSGLKLIIYSHF